MLQNFTFTCGSSLSENAIYPRFALPPYLGGGFDPACATEAWTRVHHVERSLVEER